jgi:hypothetical protein
MAVVRQLDMQVLERDSPHTEVNCTYSIISDDQGRRYLQVDTYGSNFRKIPGKKSQSIRFAPEAVEQIRAIIAQNF